MFKKLIKSNISYIKFNLNKKPNFIHYLIKKTYRKIKPYFKQLFILILHISGVLFYILSLTHIEGLGMKCFSYAGIQCYYTLAKLTCISGIITCITLYIILYKKYNKIHFFIIIINYLFLYLIDHQKEIVKHGYYNFIGFLTTTIFFFLLLNFIHFLIFLFKKKAYIFLIIFIIPFPFFYIVIKIYKLNHFSCYNWTKGLNNTYIDNSSKDYPCLVNIPKSHSCYLSEIGPFFDFTSKYRPTCLDKKIMEKEKENFINDLTTLKYSELSQRNHFGFPLTNTDEFKPDEFGNACFPGNRSFEKSIYDNIILMDLYNQNKDKYYPNIPRPEIEVIFKGDIGKIIINIEKNKSLIKERAKIIKKQKKEILYKNILIMFFDTISRAHFFRKFPKTIKFLNKFSKYETNYSKKKMSIFQYLKYNSINTYTAPNLIASYYGGKLGGSGIHFCNYFKKNGFIIGRVNNFCEKEVVINKGKINSFNHCRWDHEGLTIACIKSFYIGRFVDKLSSLVKRCLFGKDLINYSLEYLESFWKTYINQQKLFLYQALEGHEPTGQLIGHYDETYYNFLNKFYSDNLFKDTVIIIFSDHGEHLSGPLYLLNSEDFYFERTLAILFLIIPNNEFLYKNNLYEIIKYNQQIFTTPFDIYNTLVYLSNEEINKLSNKYNLSYGNSLFTKFNIKKRFCESPKYENQINQFTCNCKKKVI